MMMTSTKPPLRLSVNATIEKTVFDHPADSLNGPTSDPADREETRITWQRDGRSLHTTAEGSAWTVLANGSLRLDAVDHVDGGPYRCIARNRNGVAFSQPAFLVVHSEYSIRQTNQVFTLQDFARQISD
ncbi:hemicentin-like [Tropilaelaps mercedesae]|uniref:Hemicentin-like n=1 Tax=Tropilaelaps mercedesae TaxID=418985 RepID=A0A1V9XEE3_9ACAR|nr:hemicentin-like [Tropilaelaps mercedesae]